MSGNRNLRFRPLSAPLFSSWPPAEDPADARMADAVATPEYEGPVGEQLALFAEAAE